MEARVREDALSGCARPTRSRCADRRRVWRSRSRAIDEIRDPRPSRTSAAHARRRRRLTVRQLFRRHGPAAASVRSAQSTPAAPSTSHRRCLPEPAQRRSAAAPGRSGHDATAVAARGGPGPAHSTNIAALDCSEPQPRRRRRTPPPPHARQLLRRHGPAADQPPPSVSTVSSRNISSSWLTHDDIGSSSSYFVGFGVVLTATAKMSLIGAHVGKGRWWSHANI